MNLALLRGIVASDLQRRELGDGVVSWSFDLSCAVDGVHGRTPVVAVASDSETSAWTLGTELLIVGSVKRRFFRAGGAIQSRTEVAAASVVPARRRKAAAACLDAALSRISTG